MPAKKGSSPKKSKSNLPPVAHARLKPYIERGIANGIFHDDSSVVAMFKAKATDPSLKDTLASLGGIKSEMGQVFLTDIVLTDLTAILKQKRYTAHMEVLEISHNTIGAASGNPRQVCNIFGQVVVEDGDEQMDSALFSMSLWDNDAVIGDDVERDGVYVASVSCKNLDNAILDLRPLSGLTSFVAEEFEHGDAVELIKDTFEVMPIAELEDDISRGRNDYRLVEATVSYSGVQNSKSGNQFGKMLLKDESTMTLEAIESGENLLLNCICSTDIATRFGKYSKILALITTKNSGDYGLSANVSLAVPVILVAPPQPEVATTTEKEDDASSYFSETINLDDDDDDDAEESSSDDAEESSPDEQESEEEAETSDDTSDEEEGEEEASEGSESATSEEDGWVDGDDGDDEWGDWE